MFALIVTAAVLLSPALLLVIDKITAERITELPNE